MTAHCGREQARRGQAHVSIQCGQPCQDKSIGTDERVVAAGDLPDLAVEALEVFGQNRDLDDAGEDARWRDPSGAHAEKGKAAIGIFGPQDLTDVETDVLVQMRPEVIAVTEVDRWRGKGEAVGESSSVGIEDPYRLHFRRGVHHSLKPIMESL